MVGANLANLQNFKIELFCVKASGFKMKPMPIINDRNKTYSIYFHLFTDFKAFANI